MDLTGVVSNLTQIKTIVASGNNGISTILTFLPTNLLSMNSSQVANLANDRSGKNLNSAKITELTERISKASDGLDALLSFMNDLSINNVALAFNNIIQSEAFKTQKVEILDTWKTNMTHNLDSINTDVNILKSSFTNAQNIYNSIGNLNNNIGIIASIQAQKAIISALQL